MKNHIDAIFSLIIIFLMIYGAYYYMFGSHIDQNIDSNNKSLQLRTIVWYKGNIISMKYDDLPANSNLIKIRKEEGDSLLVEAEKFNQQIK